MNTAVWALIRPRPGNGGLTLLQLIASAVTTVLAFATTILAVRFWGTPDSGADDTGGGYRILALALVGLLLVPLLTLGTSAARLAARSRDDRLATLRLLGLSAGRVRFLAVAESTLTQALGVGAGVVLSLPLPVALSFVPVQGSRASMGDLWLPVWASASLVVLLVAIAAISAVLGLRRVVLSPLGVRARTDAPRLSPLRLVMGVIAVGAGVALTQFASPSWGVTGIVAALAAAVLLVMGVLGVVGPFAVTLLFRARVRRTSDPAVLVAARRNLEDPRAAWRQVSTIALTSFLLVPAGAMLGFLDAVQRSSTVLTAGQLALFTDARTMLLALVGVSFVVVACQVAITQTSALWEHRDLYVALDRIGMSRAVMHRARRIQTTAPVLLATIGGAGTATALTFALVAVATVNSPLFVVGIVLLLVLGLLLIRLGVEATRRVLRRVLTAPQRGE
ncbi:MAG: hypothetical protein QM607_06495 [Microbacterium sp.]